MNACDRRLWSEIFNHPPLVNVPQMSEEAYDKVFEWEVEKNEEGGYKRLGVLLHVVRNHALELRAIRKVELALNNLIPDEIAFEHVPIRVQLLAFTVPHFVDQLPFIAHFS